MATYGYCRVSTVRQAVESESLEVQRRQIQGYADMHAWPLDEVFIEEGVSGSCLFASRPEGARLYKALSDGDTLIAAKLDRVFRSALDALQMVETLRCKGVRLHLIDLGGDISGNGLSRLFLTIAAAFAEVERDRIRERIATAKADQRARSRYLGGRVPFGFRLGDEGALIPDETQLRALKLMQRLSTEGASLRQIAGKVSEQLGVSLSHAGVRKILSSRQGLDTGQKLPD